MNKKAVEGGEAVKFGGNNLTNLIYAHGAVPVAGKRRKMQKMIDRA
jgi:hypothetical protein